MAEMDGKKTMRALWYDGPQKFSIQDVPIPLIGSDEVLLKVSACGICGTDAHIHEGEFMAKFPLIPGHEAVGTLVAMGADVNGFKVGDRCVADVGHTCGNCFFCRRGNTLMCENFKAHGVAMDGGFAEYIKYKANKVYTITNLSDLDATLLEPAACAIHGLDKLRPPVGCEALILGAGPTGLILAQLLKLNGASRVVVAANKGVKMRIARDLDCADEYLELDRANPGPQWEKLAKENAYGFDVVVEATGVPALAERALTYVRRGGTLMIYGVYPHAATISWSPNKIFSDEIRIIGSFSQVHCFPRAVRYLDEGKIRVGGMVTDVFKLEDYGGALDKMRSRDAVKIAVRP